LRAHDFLLQICFATSNLLQISRAEFWKLITALIFGTPKTLAVPSYKYAQVPEKKQNTEDAQHASASLLHRRVRYFVRFVGVHRRSGEQVSGTSFSAILHRERANKVFGKRSA
jgi:hypothetical protein